MDRDEIIAIVEREGLETAARLYGIEKGALNLVGGYEGCANLVYEVQRSGQPAFLRISFRAERPAEQVEAELDFIQYLARHGARVSTPLPSVNGKLLETIRVQEAPLQIVSFIKGKGMRVPDNGYRYRQDAPIEEYFQNWGQALGRMHALTKDYEPPAGLARRPDWFTLHRSDLDLDTPAYERLPIVRERIRTMLDEIASLPRERDAYGLIHGDFNDGNFTVDYSNGDITAFDFDDCCYFYFMYELASAWEGGIGRTMRRGLPDRQAFMEHYMEQVMTGYNRENAISDAWLARLPLFVSLIQVEELLYYVRYIDDPDPDMQGELAYRIRCIEEEIPYMGFFDSIYSPEKPFSL